ncbi:MAG: DNA-binding protein WhiA [Tissierellales bacterium]|jgi:DNA-binding protein WhiA|nr:DNA-binding protein WhiA [Tissierellales bacterium]
MSFSFKTKNSLARLEFEDEITRRTELAAFVRMNATVKLVGLNKLKLKFATENAAIARRIFSILKNLYRIHTEVVVRKNRQLKKKNLYVVRVEDSDVAIQILKDSGMIFELADVFNMDYVVPEELIDNTELMRAYIRGSFLGGGSINDPEKNYHLEFVSHNHIHARDLSEIINSFDLNSKIVKRKENYIVYLKESEQIVDLLNIMGAHNALLEVENIRVMKGMRNNINRIVNCETANLSKTIDAAIRQCENIQIIESMIGIEKLPPNLREVARLRIENQEASLKELGEMLTIPLGKSGVNHRLRKIDKIADELRGKS